MQDFNSTEASEMSERNAKVASTANLVMIVVIVIAIVLALVLGLYLSRIISKPIIMIVEAANKLAEGDINIDLNIESKDETGILADAFKKLVESTKKTGTCS
jgi:methyl-accepting chemotaxis protein